MAAIAVALFLSARPPLTRSFPGSSRSLQCRPQIPLAPPHPQNVDFLVAYIGSYDAWYIIPIEQFNVCELAFAPHRKGTNCRTEPFREAWHLLM